MGFKANLKASTILPFQKLKKFKKRIKFDLIDKYNQLSKTNEIITAKTIVGFYNSKMTVLNSIVSVFKKHNNDMESLIGLQYAYGSFKNYKSTFKSAHYVSSVMLQYSTSDILLTKINYDFIYNFSQFILKARNVILMV